MPNLIRTLLLTTLTIASFTASTQTIQYTMPAETATHEGTWLQWPHNYLYGPWYQDDVEPTWIAMTQALQAGEKVHIIAYDNAEMAHINSVLQAAGVPMTNIDFFIYPTDDAWIRDNGPMFVYDHSNNLVVLDWGFNGWGFDTPFSKCDAIPWSVSNDLSLPWIDLNSVVLEGGAVVHDGKGTMMATRSSVTHPSRNPSLTEAQIESYLTTYMGITKFIWLDGVYGLEITDMHIDGFAKFVNEHTIITMNNADLLYWDVPASDIETLYLATNASGDAYNFVFLPLTQNNVVTTYGYNLGYKGSYVNYYVGNDVVLVPTYNDPNDPVAINLIQGVYPNRTAIGVDVRNLYEYGGMIHCVTQQQPLALSTGLVEISPIHGKVSQNSPNPFDTQTTIEWFVDPAHEITIDIYNILGHRIQSLAPPRGSQRVVLHASEFESGMYMYTLNVDGHILDTKKMIVQK